MSVVYTHIKVDKKISFRIHTLASDRDWAMTKELRALKTFSDEKCDKYTIFYSKNDFASYLMMNSATLQSKIELNNH